VFYLPILHYYLPLTYPKYFHKYLYLFLLCKSLPKNKYTMKNKGVLFTTIGLCFTGIGTLMQHKTTTYIFLFLGVFFTITGFAIKVKHLENE
jgi:hypothetical protein